MMKIWEKMTCRLEFQTLKIVCLNIVSLSFHLIYFMVLQHLPPPPPLTDYEKQRVVRVKQNNEVFFALNLPTLSTEVRNCFPQKQGTGSGKKIVQEGSDEEYDPLEDQVDVSNDGGSATQVKVCHILSNLLN